MGFLTGIEITRRIRSGEIEIYSTDSSEEFNVDTQVTEDSIDLRLAPQALRVKADTIALDYLDPDLATHFEEFEIPRAGYELKPGGVLLTQTLEMIAFPDELVGLVFTRSTFARLGIMVNMGAPKFAAGIHWCFPLQLANLSGYPIVLYPFAPVAQLMISDTVGQPIGYRGRYQDSCHPSPPLVSERERASLSHLGAGVRTRHVIVRAAKSGGVSRGAGPIQPEPAGEPSSKSLDQGAVFDRIGSLEASHSAIVASMDRARRTVGWLLFSVLLGGVLAACAYASWHAGVWSVGTIWERLLVLLATFVGVLGFGALILRPLGLSGSRFAAHWRRTLSTTGGWIGAAIVALIITVVFTSGVSSP